MKLPISREKAVELLKSFPQTQADMNHYLESEAVMRILAKKLGYSNTSEMIRRELLFIKHGEVKNAELTN